MEGWILSDRTDFWLVMENSSHWITAARLRVFQNCKQESKWEVVVLKQCKTPVFTGTRVCRESAL